MEESEDKKISKFSSGINILQRIDFLWKNCANFKRMGRYSAWNEELDSVWLELARDLSPEEYYDLDNEKKIIYDNQKDKKETETKGYKTQYDNFEVEMEKLMPFQDSGVQGFKKPSEIDIKRRNKQYKLLMEKQLFLARLENKVGKGTSWEEEEEDF